MTWPRAWVGPQFKQGRTKLRVAKYARRRDAINGEDKAKAEVRRQDRTCRFPRCGCRKFRVALEVSHSRQHKGMGGDPKLIRTKPETLILLCRHRHQDGAVSVHKGTLRCKPIVKPLGLRGPVIWYVDLRAVEGKWDKDPRWVEVARERERGVLEPLTDYQAELLGKLAEMTA